MLKYLKSILISVSLILFVFIGLYLLQNFYSFNLPLTAFLENKKEDVGKILLCGDEGIKFKIDYISDEIQVNLSEKKDCASIYFPITDTWHNHRASFIIKNHGNIQLILNSKFQNVTEGLPSVFVDYKDFNSNIFNSFNDEKIINQSSVYMTKVKKVKDGQTVYFDIKAKFRKFNYKDLYLYKFSAKKFLTTFFLLILLYFSILYFLKYISNYFEISIEKIIFILLFFLIILIPITNISDENISLIENRTLNKFPLLKKENNLNFLFGSEFENWLKDHFAGRKKIINHYNNFSIKFRNKVGTDLVYNTWHFINAPRNIIDYTNSTSFSDSQLKKIGSYINDLNNWCIKNNKYFVFMIAPYKYRIYPEYYPKFIKKIAPDDKSSTNQLINYLKNNYNIKTIYPVNEFVKNKNNGFIFYKNDLHWTTLGAYYGYLLLFDDITKNYKKMSNIKTRNKRLYKSIKYYARNYLHNSITYVSYYFSIDGFSCLNDITEDKDNMCNNLYGNMKIFVMGDSFVTAMYSFINNDFKQSYFRENQKYGITEKHFETFKESDVILLMVYENQLFRLEKYSFPEQLK